MRINAIESEADRVNSDPTDAPASGAEAPSPLVRQWASALLSDCHVPMSRMELHELLTEFLGRLVHATTAEDPRAGETVELVPGDRESPRIVGDQAGLGAVGADQRSLGGGGDAERERASSRPHTRRPHLVAEAECRRADRRQPRIRRRTDPDPGR